MARYILNVPEGDMHRAVDILYRHLKAHPTSTAIGVTIPSSGDAYFIRRTKTGASIVLADYKAPAHD